MATGTGSEPHRRVTIVDVARHANVSTTAVSKVLRNAYGASPAMRAKVRQAIDELGYRPHAAARGMRGQTYTIGVMLPDIRNPFFPEILDGIAEHLAGTDYQVLLGPGCDSEAAEATITNAMIDRRMDGLILIAPVSPRPHLERVAAHRAHRRHRPARPVRRTTTRSTDDDITGAALVVDHLADLGHRRIAHIEHRETDAARLAEMPNAVRAEGYRQAMRARGLAERSTSSPPPTPRRAATAAPKSCWPAPLRPTAIFAGADVAAMGVLERLRRSRACPSPTTSPSPATTTPRSPPSARSR